MPKRKLEKGIQGALSLGAYGAVQGNRLRKMYGKHATGVGAGIGSLVGGVTSYLSGVPDPNMGQGIYDNVLRDVRSNVMRNADQAADIVGDQVQTSFAKRKIEGAAPAGVEAANRGQILKAATESLVPFETQIGMLQAQDKLEAERAGEYETRQGWQDTALAVGASANQIASENLAEYQDKDVPTDFGGWSPDEQAGWLAGKGMNVPQNWAEMSMTERLNYVNRVFGMNVKGVAITPPAEQPWKQEGFPMFKPGYTAEDDARFNAEQYRTTPTSNADVRQSTIPGGDMDPNAPMPTETWQEQWQPERPHEIDQMQNPTEGSVNTTPTILHESLPQSVQDMIAETSKTPATPQEIAEFTREMPRAAQALMNPVNPLSELAKQPYSFQMLQQTAASLGDAKFAEIMEQINQLFQLGEGM